MARGLGHPSGECCNGTGASLRGVQPGGWGIPPGSVAGPSCLSSAPTAVDPNKERREAVKRKITQYLRRAEEIFNCHLQRAAGGGNPTATVRGWHGAAWVGWQQICGTGKPGGDTHKAAPVSLLNCLCWMPR